MAQGYSGQQNYSKNDQDFAQSVSQLAIQLNTKWMNSHNALQKEQIYFKIFILNILSFILSLL